MRNADPEVRNGDCGMRHLSNGDCGMTNAEYKSFYSSFHTRNSEFKIFRTPHSAFRNTMKQLLILSMVLFAGCGYQMVGKETHVPPGLNSMAIPTFSNKTLEPGIEIPFTQGFLREFINDRRVKVVTRKEADSILEGVIKSFDIYSVAYDRSGFASEYQTTVVIDLTLKKQNGEILWQEQNVTETRWYRTSTSAQVSESSRAAAIQEAGSFMAGRMRNRFFSNF
jgi:outer membrane lipopolysaccharide assembly protein LptE/RlpB